MENAVQETVAAEATQAVFVTVPETTLPSGLVVPAFQVSKFLASAGTNDQVLFDGSGAPLVNVSYHRARELAAQAGYELIKESQALSLAYNLMQVDRNWISGVMCDGDMYQGLHLDLDDVDEVCPFVFVSADATERREFYLADGSVVLDAAGNCYTWVFDDVQGNEQGIVARAFAADSPSITTAPFPSMERGVGWYPPAGRDWSGHALIRGGCWDSGGDAGVFGLGYGWPDYDSDFVGFRCTKPIGV
jgi:formylglycine-generating enzyme required for sulfatase activity